jgi:hypothetical protein
LKKNLHHTGEEEYRRMLKEGPTPEILAKIKV